LLKLEGNNINTSNHNSKYKKRDWSAYIETMRGPLSSLPIDIQKAEAQYTRQRAEARFFARENQSSMKRTAFHLIKLVNRQSG
jgi:hypothetical protein